MRNRCSINSEVERFFYWKPRIVIAVSGGADSIALAHALCEYYGDRRIELAIAHFDHKVREDSAEDRTFVEEFAQSLAVRCHSAERKTPMRQENLEAALRRERYRFLEDVRLREDAQCVVTAHHAGDVTETLLMRLIGGRELRSVEVRARDGRVLRPFLKISRLQIKD